MIITVNEEKQTIEGDNVTVENLLKICEVKDPQMVSVQLNGTFVKREVFSETLVQDSDEIDFLYFMGGGAFN